MRIIAYGLGGCYTDNCSLLKEHEVIAISDVKSKGTYGYVEPQKIQYLSYDYIVVFSYNRFEEIDFFLKKYMDIDDEKIIPYTALESRKMLAEKDVLNIKNCVREFEFKSVLAAGKYHFEDYFFSKKHFFGTDDVRRLVVISEIKLHKRLVDNVYKDEEEAEGLFDAVFVLGGFEIFKRILENKNISSKYYILTTWYLKDDLEDQATFLKVVNEYGSLKKLKTDSCIFWALYRKSGVDISENNIELYSISHKAYPIIDSEYQRLYVGDYQDELGISEKAGENISYLNDRVNECTGLYYVWKNTTASIVGLGHYRRYFLKNEFCKYSNYLLRDEISEIMEEYDIIVVDAGYMNHYEGWNLKAPRNKAIACAEYLVKKYQPDYIERLYQQDDDCFFVSKNMMICYKEIFDRYCEWLFSFLIELGEISQQFFDYGIDRRFAGYFAETMFTVWLSKQDYKVKELPILSLENMEY